MLQIENSDGHFHDKGHNGFTWASRLSLILGVGCAIHCALTPVVMIALPFLGSFLSNEYLEWTIIISSFALGVLSLWHGYKKHHHSSKALIIFLVFFGLFIAGHLLESIRLVGMALIVTGSLGLVYAQWVNYKLNQSTACHLKHH